MTYRNRNLVIMKKLESMNLPNLGLHVCSIVFFSGFGYFLIAILSGLLTGSAWTYIQSVEKHYVLQLFFLLFGVGFSHLARTLANRYFEAFFHLPKFDKFFYPIAFALAYMVINEIGGL